MVVVSPLTSPKTTVGVIVGLLLYGRRERKGIYGDSEAFLRPACLGADCPARVLVRNRSALQGFGGTLKVLQPAAFVRRGRVVGELVGDCEDRSFGGGVLLLALDRFAVAQVLELVGGEGLGFVVHGAVQVGVGRVDGDVAVLGCTCEQPGLFGLAAHVSDWPITLPSPY